MVLLLIARSFFVAVVGFQSILSLMLLLFVGCKVFLVLGDFFLSTSPLPGVDLNRPHRLHQGWWNSLLWLFALLFKKTNRNLYTKTMVTLSQPTQLWEQTNFWMHNYWGRGSRGFLCFSLHLQGCRVPRVGSLRFTECSIRLPSRSVLHSVFSNGTRARN